MVKVIIAVGVPGCGKTTFLRSKYPFAEFCSTDDLIEQYGNTLGKTYDEVFSVYIKTAEKLFFNKIKNEIENDQNIIIDRTNLSKKSRARIINFIKNITSDVEFGAIVFDVSINELGNRLNRQGKTIPSQILGQMILSFQYPEYDEGFNYIINSNKLV